jgi:NAD(P)-dependent dehydrogenase (short-subunit alcohol dehydrogenase family)
LILKEIFMSEIRYDDRVAVITGAGGGLGKTYALLLGARGAKVVVNDLGGSADGTGAGSSMADEVVKEINEAGGTAVANYDSVATPEGGEAIIQTALDNFGKCDIVINNAGILRDKSFTKLEPKNLEIVLDVHLKGAFYVTQPAFRAMKENNYGRIVMASSGAGIFGNFGQANYAAAKMGLVGLMNVLAVEGAKNNILCNSIAPIAKTRLTEALLGPLAEKLGPDYVTPLVAYLVSEQCELTHEIFDVGGGRYARVFVGMADGWTAPNHEVPSVEELAANFEQVRNTDGFSIPLSIADETRAIMQAIKD